MQASLKQLGIENSESGISSTLTMSFWVAAGYPVGQFSPDMILVPSDKGLYRTNGNGRNMVCC